MGYPEDEINAWYVKGNCCGLNNIPPLSGELQVLSFAQGYYGKSTPLEYNGVWQPQNKIELPIKKDLTNKF